MLGRLSTEKYFSSHKRNAKPISHRILCSVPARELIHLQSTVRAGDSE